MYNKTNSIDSHFPVKDIWSDFCQILIVFSKPRSDDGLISMVEYKSVSLEVAFDSTYKVTPFAVLIVFNPHFHITLEFQKLKDDLEKRSIPFILYSSLFSPKAREMTKKYGLDDYYFGPISESLKKKSHIINLAKLNRNRVERPIQLGNGRISKKVTYILKRAIDVSVSILILALLFPFLLLIALIIKLESKGPVFYISKRAGCNYHVFNFYKFRSMNSDAEAQLKNMMNKNQYATGAFVKIKSDPRVTRFGSFLRKTSLDEIPQLINVIKGNMHLVGNRPLPLYEATALTKDQAARRFLAPAGITGLWQITKRGKENMSEEERIQLDIAYANKTSFWYDLKLLINTIPALLQKESV